MANDKNFKVKHGLDAGNTITAPLFSGSVNESAVTAHEAALTITESQISDLKTYTETRVSGKGGLATGVASGGVLSIGTPSSTFSISDGSGVIVDQYTDPENPTITEITWSGKSNITVTNIATHLVTYVALDSSGTVIQSTTPFTDQNARDYMILGIVAHTDNSVVDSVNVGVHSAFQSSSQLHDFMGSIGLINVSGNAISNVGAGLTIQKSAGTLAGVGVNWDSATDAPNKKTMASQSPITFQYRFQDGSNGATDVNVNPNIYDVSGTSTAVTTDKFTVQRVYMYPAGTIKILPGQAMYDTMNAAKASIGSDSFVVDTTVERDAIMIGLIAVQEGTTDLSDSAAVQFISPDMFGQAVTGGSAGSTNLQEAYENSTANPEILTADAGGAFHVRRGTTGGDTDNVFEVQNNAGTANYAVTGEGNVTANQFSGAVVSSSVTVTGGTISGTDVDVTSQTLTLDDNQISGDKVHGGTVSNFASTGIDDTASTSTNLTITDSLITTGASLEVTGDLTVNGSTTVVNSTNTALEDGLIELANGYTGAPINDTGIVIERGTETNAFIGWDESEDKFHMGTGSFTGASSGNLTITTGTLLANVEGNVTGNVTGDVTGNADTATALETARTIELSGDVTGSASFDGTADINIVTSTTAANNFSTIAVSGQSNVVADSSADTLTLAGANNVVITTNATTDTVTFTGPSDSDIKTSYENNADTNAFTDAEQTKLSGIETGADVTDATNVAAAGAVMDADTDASGYSFVVDEDTMTSDSATKLPTQQSVKAYVDTQVSNAVASSVEYQGGYNASTNTPDLDTAPSGITKGDMYTVTTAGTFFATDVEVGDVLIAEQDSPTLEAHWTIVNKNLDDASIKVAYENNADTNAFTDAEQTKLSGIATGAEVNQNAFTTIAVSGQSNVEADTTTDTLTFVEGSNVTITTNAGTDAITIASTDTTYSAGTGLGLSGTTFNVDTDLSTDGVHTIGLDANDKIAVTATSIDFTLDGNLDMRLENDGDLHVDGDVVAFSTTTSDERLKKDIVKIENALDKVDQLGGYTFTYKHDDRKSAGVIAQEVEKVLPSAITEKALPLQTENDDTEYKTVAYDQLHALMIESIKELREENRELKARLDKLEGK